MSHQEDQLRQALRSYAAGIAANCAVPPASTIWLRAERRSRREALRQAELPLRIMQGLGLLCAVLAAAWLLHQSDVLRQFAVMGNTPIVLIFVSVLLVVGGCSAMLLTGRRMT